jgi:hypothetical protein
MEFDEYIGIDWSGAKSPQQSYSIALATCSKYDNKAPAPVSKKLSRTDVYNLIIEKLKGDKRVLIGIDCNFGYAASVAKKQLGEAVNYRQLWEAVDSANAAHKNFFAGNTWSTSDFAEYFWTQGKQPDWFNPKVLRRHTETAAAEQGLGIPESPFKLIGAKQVGKGGLAGMRLLHRLKNTYGDKIAVWPFEASLIASAQVVVTEIYPRLFIKHAGFGNNKVRDINNLNEILTHFSCKPFVQNEPLNDHLSDAIIATAGLRWYCNHKTPLSVEIAMQAMTLEGWIFGVDSPFK